MNMSYKIAFFGAKPYDIASFDQVNEKYNYDIKYYKGHLNPNNVVLTQDADAVCIFVNDTADAAVIDAMADNGVKLLALRCAGFNNVDLAAAKGKLPVVRVPAYSPYAVAEYSLALMLSLNRKIHRAYWRTRDGNFSLNGLMGFDMHGKTVGIIGTGKIAKILIRILKGLGMHILAYDLWNFEYTYNNLPTHAWYCGLALLLAPTFANAFWNKGGWIQNRANTLALWCMFAQVFPLFQDTGVFAVLPVLYTDGVMNPAVRPGAADPTMQGVIAILALAANVCVLAAIIRRSVKQKKNPYRNEIFTDQRDFQLAMERAEAQ